jgi:hypothetical protein
MKGHDGRKIYILEENGFPEIEEQSFIFAESLPFESMEFVEWTGVGGGIFSSSECLYICIKFKQGGFIKGYIAVEGTLVSIFEFYKVRTINMIDADTNTERAQQINRQYKEFIRLIGKNAKKEVLAILDSGTSLIGMMMHGR